MSAISIVLFGPCSKKLPYLQKFIWFLIRLFLSPFFLISSILGEHNMDLLPLLGAAKVKVCKSVFTNLFLDFKSGVMYKK